MSGLAGGDWTAGLASALGVPPPTPEELADLLELAGVAAHASERWAAPLSCWLVARAGMAPAEALALARRLAGDDDPVRPLTVPRGARAPRPAG